MLTTFTYIKDRVVGLLDLQKIDMLYYSSLVKSFIRFGEKIIIVDFAIYFSTTKKLTSVLDQ